MSFDLNILVNGNRCKQHQHEGKTYIEAKNGSEYVIEIKNNHYKRVLAVCSVDGLNVLTGKTASETDTGYIIGPYSSEKIKGFRFSDSEWAIFKFGYKFYGNTYAQSKEDGSEKNCGIIGIKLFYEKELEPSITYTINTYPPVAVYPWWPYYTWPTWWYQGYSGTGLSAGNINTNYSVTGAALNNATYTCNNGSGTGLLAGNIPSLSNVSANYCCSAGNEQDLFAYHGNIEVEQPKQKFDMGTEWGRKEYSKVHSVSFERGYLAQAFDIYYASREALLNMGIPLNKGLSVNLPQSFPGGYAQPPKNWNG
jgi:hypothetical protein